MESVWWVFSQLFEQGLIYEGFKVMPFSARLGTPLSNFEANLNYKEVNDPSLTVKFPVKDKDKTYFMVWTTTPWTLVSNLAIAVGKDIDYVEIELKEDSSKYILAKALLDKYFKDKEYKITKNLKGKDLVNKKYEPLFPYFKDHENAFRVIEGDFVSLEDGTGIVHMAPAFGEDDFYACKKENITPVCPVDENGRFLSEIKEFEDIYVKDADKPIIKDLKQRNLVFHHGQILHRYPYCWRTDTPLIYKAVNTWFVAVEKFKDKIIKSNEQIYWMPEHIKYGRFGKWLENARDWAISRNRYWGTPIPIWISEDGDIKVFGSIEELEKLAKVKITDLHRHHIDDITFEINGKKYKRISEVFDCWFESGSMPYAQNHYPFENVKLTEDTFPADFIAEGLDQTRGWFYTLNVLSTALFNKPAFKNVIVNGIILAEDGNKMSKRLKNYPEPNIVIDKYGSDALRLYLLHSPAVKAEDLRFSEHGLELVLRQVLIPLWNSYSFLATYANIYDWKPTKDLLEKPTSDIDRWIISRVNNLINVVESSLEKYDLSKAIDPLIEIVDELTNWYIRRSRQRFWSDEDSSDRRSAFSSLYYALMTISKVSAPFVPFISEKIYQELKTDDMPLSVHLCDYPEYSQEKRDESLEREMSYVKRAVSMGHALRKEAKLKVRQPLKKAFLIAPTDEISQYFEKQKNLILEELNVKEIEIHREEGKFIQVQIKPNFRILGKKMGKLMPKAQKVISVLDKSKIQKLMNNENVSIEVENEKIEITQEDVIIERKVKENITAASDSEIAVAFDTVLSEDLILEGLARELVNKINTMRRDFDFAVQDRIKVIIETTDKIKKAYDIYHEYICNEVLAVEVKFENCIGESWDLNGEKTTIAIEKVIK